MGHPGITHWSQPCLPCGSARLRLHLPVQGYGPFPPASPAKRTSSGMALAAFGPAQPLLEQQSFSINPSAPSPGSGVFTCQLVLIAVTPILEWGQSRDLGEGSYSPGGCPGWDGANWGNQKKNPVWVLATWARVVRANGVYPCHTLGPQPARQGHPVVTPCGRGGGEPRQLGDVSVCGFNPVPIFLPFSPGEPPTWCEACREQEQMASAARQRAAGPPPPNQGLLP